MIRDDSDDPFTSADAFGLLGNEHRAEIIRTLGAAQGRKGPRPTLAFSELYHQSEADIATSQFNYHLQKLVGQFVEKTDGGYRLRHEGVELYRTILAGTYTTGSDLEPFSVGSDCFYCDSPVKAQYSDRRFTIACSECGREYSDTTVPPSAIEENQELLLTRIDQYLRRRILAFSKGVCSVCANRLQTSILHDEDLPDIGPNQLDLYIHRSCGHCGAQQYMSAGLAFLYHAPLIGFFCDRGLDITTTPIWELEFAMTDRYTSIRQTDPWRIELEITQSDDELTLVFNQELAVVEQQIP